MLRGMKETFSKRSRNGSRRPLADRTNKSTQQPLPSIAIASESDSEVELHHDAGEHPARKKDNSKEQEEGYDDSKEQEEGGDNDDQSSSLCSSDSRTEDSASVGSEKIRMAAEFQRAKRLNDQLQAGNRRKAKKQKLQKRDIGNLSISEVAESGVNLRCNKDIQTKFHWTKCLQAPPSFRSSHEKFLSFLKMSREEQKTSQKEYTNIKANTKAGKLKRQKILSQMIGTDCDCKNCPKGCLEPVDLLSEEAKISFDTVCLNCGPSIDSLMKNKDEMRPYKKKGHA